MSDITSDDRYGYMRIHIADRRASAACMMYTRDHLRAVAKSKGLKLSGLNKHLMAWHMAQEGLIDAYGRLRDGFPEGERK